MDPSQPQPQSNRGAGALPSAPRVVADDGSGAAGREAADPLGAGVRGMEGVETEQLEVVSTGASSRTTSAPTVPTRATSPMRVVSSRTATTARRRAGRADSRSRPAVAEEMREPEQRFDRTPSTYPEREAQVRPGRLPEGGGGVQSVAPGLPEPGQNVRAPWLGMAFDWTAMQRDYPPPTDPFAARLGQPQAGLRGQPGEGLLPESGFVPEAGPSAMGPPRAFAPDGQFVISTPGQIQEQPFSPQLSEASRHSVAARDDGAGSQPQGPGTPAAGGRA